MSVKKKIALAIKRADKSYFFEDYEKQAAAVIRALEADGYVIVPSAPDAAILKKAADSLSTGKMKPEQHIQNVHETLIKLLR
jgi:hypothetical protein